MNRWTVWINRSQRSTQYLNLYPEIIDPAQNKGLLRKRKSGICWLLCSSRKSI